jgi:GT2 family glycosyltransferase
MNNSITVILNAYRRPQYLEEQFNAVFNQSIKPDKIYLWYNKHEDTKITLPDIIKKNCITTVSNYNFGVWARFAYALNAKTKYVCIFDDDTIPGSQWLENCLKTIDTHRGLLGTYGFIFKKRHFSLETSFQQVERYGWIAPHEETLQVDIVGHAWFFEREWLSYYWRELPPINFFYGGEDMHFSYILQKYLKLNTYIPPHPKNNKNLWGSLKGQEYGSGIEATSGFAVPEMYSYYNHILKNGFKTINQ